MTDTDLITAIASQIDPSDPDAKERARLTAEILLSITEDEEKPEGPVNRLKKGLVDRLPPRD